MGEGEERVVNPFDLIEYLVQRHLRPRLGRVVLALLAFGFAWFIWPTPYRAIGPGGMMQVNRLTGVRCPVGESCWQERREPSTANPPTVNPPSNYIRPASCRDWVDTGRNTVTDLVCRGGPAR